MLGKLFGKKKKVGEERARMETKSFFDCIAQMCIRDSSGSAAASPGSKSPEAAEHPAGSVPPG